MTNKILSRTFPAVLALLAMAAFFTTARASAQETVLQNFANTEFAVTGNFPSGGLIFDASGNLFGTNLAGGTSNVGTVFELTPNASGGYSEKVLYNFKLVNDGYEPNSVLIFDSAGNLYGTTTRGGDFLQGTVFQLSPSSGGTWTEKVLHSFGKGTDGQTPYAGLTLGSAGNFYGTTIAGGSYNGGIAFRLKRTASGAWVENVIYNFGNGSDALYPVGGLIFDASGNLYGTTQYGGIYFGGRGAVYKLSPTGSGRFTETVLHSFGSGQDGEYPQTPLVFDPAGNLYGTTLSGGTLLSGTVFKLTPAVGGLYQEAVLYNFDNPNLSEGILVTSGVTLDAAGNLYGETAHGTGATLYGSVFELSLSGGVWTETQLITFFRSSLGCLPAGGLIFGTSGNLYGETVCGGPGAGGTVFEVVP